MLYKHAAKASLDHMGSVAVKKVKPEQAIESCHLRMCLLGGG